MEQHIFGVTEVNELVKLLLDNEPMLQNICVRGELSNYKIYPSGHHYFTLKDAGASIRCVMFRADASRLRFRPENGIGVICAGRVAVYPRDGAYQLYVSAVQPEGLGDLHAAYEQLKAKLAAEGLFDPAHKKPLPKFPAVTRDIALVVDESVGAGTMMETIRKSARNLEDVRLFDIYRGKGVEDGKKSVAFSLTMRAEDQTLTDDHAEETVKAVLDALKTAFGAVMR